MTVRKWKIKLNEKYLEKRQLAIMFPQNWNVEWNTFEKENKIFYKKKLIFFYTMWGMNLGGNSSLNWKKKAIEDENFFLVSKYEILCNHVFPFAANTDELL